jgi:DNA segregation ATPase FtsK/SpoIIIE-like protein
LLHQLSTDLGGLPVYLSNHSGIRYVVLLSPLPKLPRKVDFPIDAPGGKLAIGVRFIGQPVLLEWETFLHLAVLGATGSGKSVFLQALVYQAIRDGMRVLLSDIDQSTFGMLAGHPSLAAPIAATAQDALGLVEKAIAECDRRAGLFQSLPEHPQKLSEYNALAVKQDHDPLPRMLVVLDEASTVLATLGGAKGALGQALATWAGAGASSGCILSLRRKSSPKTSWGRCVPRWG